LHILGRPDTFLAVHGTIVVDATTGAQHPNPTPAQRLPGSGPPGAALLPFYAGVGWR
jgi:hypothetical protein